MTRKKILHKIIKPLGFILFISGSLLTCSFFTHPSFMEQQVTEAIPFLKAPTVQISPVEKIPEEIPETECYEYKIVSPLLNDKRADYIRNSAKQKFGEPIKTEKGIRPYYQRKKLVLVDSSDVYVVDSLTHSYAYLTKDAKALLDEVGKRFQEKISNTSLRNSRIVVTSLLRTESTVKSLMRQNKNSVKMSSHLHGTSFDIAHNEFISHKALKEPDISYLREMLAETLFELREQDRCFVTYEINQACFHVVNKKTS